ncbi:MAG: hypothetical protein MUC83_03410 [Pirellula sp.]|jgi:hypothetical protein|nr:hypothetical protein [Pirellula sp.]
MLVTAIAPDSVRTIGSRGLHRQTQDRIDQDDRNNSVWTRLNSSSAEAKSAATSGINAFDFEKSPTFAASLSLCEATAPSLEIKPNGESI